MLLLGTIEVQAINSNVMEIESIFDCNLLFPAGVFPDRDRFSSIYELAYYKKSNLSIKGWRSIS